MSAAIDRLKSLGALLACALFALGATPAIPAAPLPPPLAADVRESFRLLTGSYYDAIDPQALLAAASDALADAAHKRGVAIAPPALRAQADSDATVAQLDDAIAASAQAAHAPATDFAYAALAAMAKAVGDKYTQFFTPDEFRAFSEGLDPKRISGIGVMIEPDQASGFVRLYYVVPKTPADRAGLQVGDVIQSIDGKSTHGLAVDDVSKLLRGTNGSQVALSVVRQGRGAASDVALTREEVQPPTVMFRMLPGSIGYVWVLAFGKGTPDEFDTAIARLKQQGSRALILDLRNDGGGYVDSALTISSRFIANKALLTVEERGNHATTIKAEDDTSIALPVSVLVNQYTASASEITAGALQDDGVGQLVGTTTYGKGVMQTLTPLPDGAAIKITTAHYLTPKNRDINKRGIEPDLHVDENRDARFGAVDSDAQLRAAIALLEKKIADARPL